MMQLATVTKVLLVTRLVLSYGTHHQHGHTNSQPLCIVKGFTHHLTQMAFIMNTARPTGLLFTAFPNFPTFFKLFNSYFLDFGA